MLTIYYCNHASVEDLQREGRLTAGSAVMWQHRQIPAKRIGDGINSPALTLSYGIQLWILLLFKSQNV